MEYYYTGQFGYFNLIILPLLRKYNGPTLKIHTFPDYRYILNNLYGNKFIYVDIPLVPLRIGHNCNENLSIKTLYPSLETLYSFTDIIDISGNNTDLSRNLPFNDIIDGSNNSYNPCELSTTINLATDSSGNYNKYNVNTILVNIYEMSNFDFIKSPITTSFIDTSANNFICYFPRFRNSGTLETDWDLRNGTTNQIRSIINFYKNIHTIYIVGREVVQYNYNLSGVVRVTDIERTIFYLRNCKFLITNDSGFIDFAKNCGCPKILILLPINTYHTQFEPTLNYILNKDPSGNIIDRLNHIINMDNIRLDNNLNKIIVDLNEKFYPYIIDSSGNLIIQNILNDNNVPSIYFHSKLGGVFTYNGYTLIKPSKSYIATKSGALIINKSNKVILNSSASGNLMKEIPYKKNPIGYVDLSGTLIDSSHNITVYDVSGKYYFDISGKVVKDTSGHYILNVVNNYFLNTQGALLIDISSENIINAAGGFSTFILDVSGTYTYDRSGNRRKDKSGNWVLDISGRFLLNEFGAYIYDASCNYSLNSVTRNNDPSGNDFYVLNDLSSGNLILKNKTNNNIFYTIDNVTPYYLKYLRGDGLYYRYTSTTVLPINYDLSKNDLASYLII
jgi:hypothetical protein